MAGVLGKNYREKITGPSKTTLTLEAILTSFPSESGVGTYYQSCSPSNSASRGIFKVLGVFVLGYLKNDVKVAPYGNLGIGEALSLIRLVCSARKNRLG
jgi:hypothetical protein